MPDNVPIRHFKLMPDGEIEFWYASSTVHYGGACPSVGDTIGSLYPEGDDEIYSVTRRYFFDEPDRESGWALILRPLASDPILKRVTEAYRREASADREEEARQEERLALRAAEAHQKLLHERRPRPANRRIVSILRWLATRVYDAIDGGLPSQTQTAPTQTSSGTLRGPVTRIVDGDTFTIGSQRVRICGINSPERGERGYAEAGANLERMTTGQTVECRQVGTGTPCDGRSSPASYDRIVAQCFVGGRDIAAEQVRAGHAEDWTRYSGGYYAR